jgi:FG-GAP-like repeat/Salmonella virulence plasmid 65kDa B protein
MKRMQSLWWLALVLPGLAQAAGWSSATHTLVAGDFNGDGKQDILYVAKDAEGTSGIALSDGTAPSIDHQSWSGNYLGIPWHSGTYLPVVGDFNADGKADILLHRQTPGDHYVLLANGVGQITSISQIISNTALGQEWGADKHRIVSGDFDGDGRADLFLQATNASVSSAVVLASAGGQFTTGPAQTWGNLYMGFQWSLNKAVVHAGDFNGDGKADLFVQAKPDIILIDYDIPIPVPKYRPGSFGIVDAKATSVCGAIFCGTALQIFDRNYLGGEWSASFSNLIIGDYDGDGRRDILIQSRTPGRLNQLLLAGASGQFSTINALQNSTVAAMSGDQHTLLAVRYGATGGAGLYAVAAALSGTNYTVAQITSNTTAYQHDANLLTWATPGTAVGAMPGEFSVDPSGAAMYRIPIAVPPGVAGVAPELAMGYSSRGGNGLLGVGMALEGLSAITRCGTSVATDGIGKTDGADFDGNDAFCLDGQRLIAVVGSNGSVAAEYRTEINTFRKVVSSGGSAGDPAGFKVWDKAGLIYEYGLVAPATAVDAQVKARINATVGLNLVWALKVVKDRFDNFIEYTYEQSTTATEFRPTQVTWGSQYLSAKTVVGRVAFEYTDRSNDSSSGYMAGGFMTSLTKRLQKIHVYSRASTSTSGATLLVRSYFVNYEISPTSNLSHATSILMCDGGSGSSRKCFKDTKLDWQHGTRGFSDPIATAVSSTSLAAMKVVDVTGDGINDYVGESGGKWVARQGFLQAGVTTPGTFTAKNKDHALVMDWNSDGYMDVVQRSINSATSGNYEVLMGGPGSWGTGATLPSTVPAVGLSNNSEGTAVGDFNGDGRQDMAFMCCGSAYTNQVASATGGTLKIHLNTATGLTATTASVGLFNQTDVINDPEFGSISIN